MAPSTGERRRKTRNGPLCFVLMPFQKKADPARKRTTIDFDAIYEKAIKPAIEKAGLQPIRADKEVTGGVIHKAMFERLLLCDFAVADLTIPNANVFYELGVRHASRHNTTLPIFAEHTTPPFDLGPVRAMPYRLGPRNRFGTKEAELLRAALTKRLVDLRNLARTADAADSPIHQLLGKVQQSNLPLDARLRRIKQADTALYDLLNRYALHDKTDVFRPLVQYNEQQKKELAVARALPKADALKALGRVQEALNLDDAEAGTIVDLYLSYRALGAWPAMLALYERMPISLKRSVLVREQRAFALNRKAESLIGEASKKDAGDAAAQLEAQTLRGTADGLRTDAIGVLEGVLTENGPSSETYGLLGRIHKARWEEALAAKREVEAKGHLLAAIDSYAKGFTADWRDAYPGVNAVTLLDVEGSAESLQRRDQFLPVVRFAVEQRLVGGTPDYWDYATLLELQVLASDVEASNGFLAKALVAVRESFEPATTAKNLGYILKARTRAGADAAWLAKIVAALKAKAEA